MYMYFYKAPKYLNMSYIILITNEQTYLTHKCKIYTNFTSAKIIVFLLRF
jgi:hypothetical protein